jgi:tetratricopeptide (TPR) repeat protein
MQCARISMAVAALLALLGVTSRASAQESSLDALQIGSRGKPSDVAASMAYGRALRRAGRYADALTELRRGQAYAKGQAAIDVRYEMARVAIDKRDHNGAMSVCRSIASLPGGANESHACAADVHLMWRRASEALLETEQALANGDQVFEAKLAEGRAYELELREDVAEKSFRDALAWRPDSSEAHYALGRLLAREPAKRSEGVQELKRALSLDPNGPEENYELAVALGNTVEAAALLENAVHEKPNYAAALRRLAELDLELQKIPDARKYAEAALKVDATDAASHIVMGRVDLSENKPDDAIKEAQAALGVVANSAHAKLIVGDAYAKKNEIDLAVEAYQAAYGFDHSDPAPLVHASRACHAAGRDTSAKAFGEKATKEFPEWGPGWVVYGDALAAQKDAPAARTAYETALKSKGPVDAAAVQGKLAALK